MNPAMDYLKYGGISLLILELIWWIGVGSFILLWRKKKLGKNKSDDA